MLQYAVTLESSLVRTEICVLHVLSQELPAEAGQRLNPMKCDISSLNEIRVLVAEILCGDYLNETLQNCV